MTALPDVDSQALDAAALRPLFLLRSDLHFLNHGSFGACPRPVFEQYGRWQLELEAQPVEFLGRRAPERLRESRAALAAYLGADRDDLVYVPNASTGLNVVARSLRLQPGDEVLTGDHEYGAMDRTWRFVCDKTGAVYRKQPLPLPFDEPEAVVEAIWSGVTERTRVLFLSHVTSPTAVILPIEPLIRRARAAGIITVIDGAHAPGQLDLDLEQIGADFYAGNCHKWLMAPKGAAFLHVRRPMQTLLDPLVISWGWGGDKPWPERFIEEHEYQGTRDIAAYLTVPAAIQFAETYSWPTVRRRCHALLCEVREKITALTQLAPLCPADSRWFRQMASIPLPMCDGVALQRRLYDEHRVEVPITRWNDRLFVRVSIQGYTTPADVDALVEGLRVLLPG